jgi:xanthine dehydrogenase accessory factor
MSLHEVSEALKCWNDEGRESALATLVAVRHSAPRLPGARFAVNDRGDVAGSVSSGCVEGDLFEHLRDILSGRSASVLTYGITDEMAADVGLVCGGEIEVLIARHRPDAAWNALVQAVEASEPVVLVTGVSESIRGQRMLVRADAPPIGTLGASSVDEQVTATGERFLDGGDAGVVSLGTEATATLEVFVEPFRPAPRLAIVGASPIAAALCRIAVMLGYDTAVIDPRETFAAKARFPEARRVIHAWPEEGLRSFGLDRQLSVVVLSHDRKLDVPALAAALRADCRYVGLLGGGRTQKLRREELSDLGFDAAALDSIRGPVGLSIGSRTPEEIAVSIAAELVATRRGAVDKT